MLTDFGFYHLTRSTLDDALPRLMSKMAATGKRTLIRLGVPERIEVLDRLLWTFEADSWLPHGNSLEPFAERQPILLSAQPSGNPNNAAFLVLIDGADASDAVGFERVLELFDGNDDQAVGQARKRWSWAQSQGFECVYWQQNQRGGWQLATGR